jgi:flagellar basal-body rod modification protein FlgD
MSASITASQSSALAAADQAAAAAAATASKAASAAASGSSGSSTSASTTTNALTSLTSNFNDFLNLLMTQLQNQDPTSPMDTTQFTSELVQFASVEQQISTNSSLGTLIQATQGSETLQASAMVGKTVDATTAALPLQNSSGSVQFTTPAAEPVAIAVYDSAGNEVRNITATSNQGSNTWTWNGTNDAGTQLPDGTYRVDVETANANGVATAVPFTVQGTVTGVSNSGTTVDLQLGTTTVPLSSVQQVGS